MLAERKNGWKKKVRGFFGFFLIYFPASILLDKRKPTGRLYFPWASNGLGDSSTQADVQDYHTPHNKRKTLPEAS